MARDDLLDELGDGAGVAYVAGDEVLVAVGRRRAPADDDVGSGGAVGLRDAAAETAGAAGDQDDAQLVAPASSSAMAVTARWPKAMAGVMHAPGPG